MRSCAVRVLAAAVAATVSEPRAQTAETLVSVKEAMRKIAREYLLEHPEIIKKA